MSTFASPSNHHRSLDIYVHRVNQLPPGKFYLVVTVDGQRKNTHDSETGVWEQQSRFAATNASNVIFEIYQREQAHIKDSIGKFEAILETLLDEGANGQRIRRSFVSTQKSSPLNLALEFSINLHGMKNIPSVAGNTDLPSVGNQWLKVIERLDLLLRISQSVHEVNSVAKMAVTLFTNAYDVIRSEIDHDEKIGRLLEAVLNACRFFEDSTETERRLHESIAQRRLVAQLVRQIIESYYFVDSYARNEFVTRVLEVTNVDIVIADYVKKLNKFKNAWSNRTLKHIEVTTHRFADIAQHQVYLAWLGDLPYSRGAHCDGTGGCLPDTRTSILDEIDQWVHQSGEDVPRLFVLYGGAGTGKSAIANSVAKTYGELGRLASSFGFLRGDATRHSHFLFPTLSRDLADCDAAFRQALDEIVGTKTHLRQSHIISEQFENLVLKPICKLTLVGPLVVVIDALDECDPENVHHVAQQLLTNTSSLPTNIRILITCHPDKSLLNLFQQGAYIKTKWMEDGDAASILGHIQTFVLHELEACEVTDAGAGVAPLKEQINKASTVALSSDGKRVVSGNTVPFRVAKIGLDDEASLKGFTASMSVVFSSDGMRVMSVSWDNTVQIWDAQTGLGTVAPLEGHTGSIHSIAFSPNGMSVVSGSWDKTAQIWDAKTGLKTVAPLKGHTDRVSCVAFSPDGIRVVSGSHDNTVRIWDAEIGLETVASLKGHAGPVSSVAFSPDGIRVVSGSWDMTVRIWDVKTGLETVAPLKGHAGPVSSVAFSPDGIRVVSGSWDMTVRIWDVKTGLETVAPLKGHAGPVSSVAFSPDGMRIVSGSRDMTVRIWDVKTGLETVAPFGGHIDKVSSVAFSPDGMRIVSGSWDETVQIWYVNPELENVALLRGHTGPINSVAFSPDGKKVVSGSWEKTVQIWDAETGFKSVAPLEGHSDIVSSVVLSPDRNSGLADNSMQIWDTETGPVPLKEHTSPVSSVVLSLDGKRMMSEYHAVTAHILIEAKGALNHIINLDTKAKIQAAFHDLQVLESEYLILAGFNEALIQSGFGYLEEIHIFCSTEIPNASLLSESLYKMGKILTPYPGIIFTPSSGYKTPVFKDDGTIWDYNDFSLHHTKSHSDICAKGISDLGLNAFMSLTGSQPSSSMTALGGGNDEHGGNEEDEVQDHSDDDNDEGHNNPNDEKPEDGPEDPEPEDAGNGDSSMPCIFFEVQAKIFLGTSDSISSMPFQELGINGALVVQTIPAEKKPRRRAKSHVEFKKLKLQGRKPASPGYEQVHVRVEINTNNEDTTIHVLQPLQTPAFDQATTEIIGSKLTAARTLGGSLAVEIIKPTAMLSVSGSRSRETSSSTELKKYHSRITEHHQEGCVSWGFTVDDMNERQVGIEFGRQRALPIVDFEFFGPSDVELPPPPPELFDVVVQSCWSLISPRNDSHTSSSWFSWFQGLSSGTASSKLPLYSNLCQVIILKVPSNVSQETLYRSVTEVTQSSSKTIVKRQCLHDITSTILPLNGSIESGDSYGPISSSLQR